eukprot:COSAG02_NODE_1595_length_11773_cov_5.122739_7_plen_82_part_00
MSRSIPDTTTISICNLGICSPKGVPTLRHVGVLPQWQHCHLAHWLPGHLPLVLSQSRVRPSGPAHAYLLGREVVYTILYCS